MNYTEALANLTRRFWTRLWGGRKSASHGGWSGKWLGYGACGVWGCRDCR